MRFLLPLASLGLLLGVLSCAEKDKPLPTPTASYQHDGVAVTCTVETRSSTANSGPQYDYLELDLLTTPQPASGPEVLRVYFHKPSGRPASAYVPEESFALLQGKSTLSYFATSAATITLGSDGSFSGSFSAKVLPLGGGAPAPYLAIANGVFSNVRP